MRVFLLAMALTTLACAGPPPPKPTPIAETVMDTLTRGGELLAAQDYAGALAAFQRCSQLAPADDRCPYNGGLAAYLDGQYPIAAQQWQRAKTLDASNWRVRAKLIQAYQGAGDLRARDAERAELFAQHSSATASAELLRTEAYCRDQWTWESYRVMAFEYFATTSAGALLRYRFLMGKNGGEQAAEWLALASLPDAGGRHYALMMFTGNESPAVFLAEYASWDTEPPYDELRKLMIAIVQGTQKPLRGNPLTLK